MTKPSPPTLLHVNLSTGQTSTLSLRPETTTLFLGGKGLGASLLCDHVKPGTDPLGPDNILLFLAGPLTGTLAPALRGCVVTKSPLTSTFLDSYFGGSFAPEIKYAGYEGLLFTGISPEPVYLWIDNDTVTLRPAGHLWGTGTLQTNAAIKEELKDDSIKIACIGPAGENLVRYSLIGCEYNRQAGRGGAGAVMGSKKLKGIAIRGSQALHVQDPQYFTHACSKALTELSKSPDVDELRRAGTASAVTFANTTGMLPFQNYQKGTWEKASGLADKAQQKHLWLGSNACMGCPICCAKTGAIRTGKYKGIVSDIVEYESACLMGTNLAISDIKAVAHLVKLCDDYGLDSMSTGTVIGFAMEACEKGLLRAPDTIELCFGNVAAAQYLIHAIVRQQEDIGVLLGQGVREAARQLGTEAESIAMHTKGLETPAWGPRGSTGMGLAYMTTDRGGCHQRGFPLAYEYAGEWSGLSLDPQSLEHKAALVVELQNHSAGTDTLIKCDFGSFGISTQTYAELVTAATGREITAQTLLDTGERIWTLTRLFNLANGVDPSQDILPRRFIQEPLPDGPGKGHRFSQQDMHCMLQQYYALRGWTAEGIPSESTLKRLQIHYDPNH